jgi:hypothetical protein
MKLELKHLAPYLPYGLKLVPDNYRSMGSGYGYYHRELDIDALYRCNIEDLKPILRPMSDFDKMGLLGDDHYSYMSKLNKEVIGEWFVDRDLDFEIDSHNDTSYFPANTAYNLYEFLFEHHFDVFGLIPAGLAVDINTITS